MGAKDPAGCPICGQPVVKATRKPGDPPDPYPFCSARCQLVDLGRWLGDEYRVPDRDTVVWPPDADGDDPTRR